MKKVEHIKNYIKVIFTFGYGMALLIATLVSAEEQKVDLRNIRTGSEIYKHGYCDQPYVVITRDGNWLCVFTTGAGREGHPGQHIVATISKDKGHTWSQPTPLEPADGPDASWAMPLVTPGGIEKDGYLDWSQPEILLYDSNIKIRISYPDLIEQDGRYWITETQKTIARAHEVNASLLEGLWNQGRLKEITKKGLIFNWDANRDKKSNVNAPQLPDLSREDGITLEMWLQFADLTAGQVILDNRNEKGKGIIVQTTNNSTLQITLNDGKRTGQWDCDPDKLQTNKLHHIVIIVDGGPKIISFVVDGVLCDGGTQRQYGWGRFPKKLGDINGAKQFTFGSSLQGELKIVRLYDRYLRTSEAIANYQVPPILKNERE